MNCIIAHIAKDMNKCYLFSCNIIYHIYNILQRMISEEEKRRRNACMKQKMTGLILAAVLASSVLSGCACSISPCFFTRSDGTLK